MAPPARILALDVGLRRIGIAVSDELGITAQGLPTLERINLQADLQALRDLAARYRPSTWLVGLPLHLSGDESRQAGLVRAFGDRLAASSRLPVRYWDERFTTVVAEQVLRSASSSRLQKRAAVDRLAAVVLLQSFLDSQPANFDPATGIDPSLL